MKNKLQTKDNSTGKFQKVNPVLEVQEATQEQIDRTFILKVKQDLYDGYLYLDEIKKAYILINGEDNSLVNLRVMKLAILSYT